MKNTFITLFALYLCLNGQLFATNKPMFYGVSTNTISIEQAVDLQTPCPTQFLFDSGFEDAEQIVQSLVDEALSCRKK